MYYFFSAQYSAIQKTVLRHNRLWSIVGISQELSRLNEITLPVIAKELNGKVMVAGGGKFTAWFKAKKNAEDAKKSIIKKISTSFPMLEFQFSEIIGAEQFRSNSEEINDNGANKSSAKGQGIIEQLAEGKHQYRGYGTSFLPHLATCEECGELPAEQGKKSRSDKKNLCRICNKASESARINPYDEKSPTGAEQTTLEKIYSTYITKLENVGFLEPVYNFDDFFPKKQGDNNKSKQRMAVWFSDLNNMNSKVPIWLDQDDDKVLDTFREVSTVNVEIVAAALANTFPKPVKIIPFRLVVAGGDDLCLVMREKHILDFALNLDREVRETIARLNDENPDSPLSLVWLNEHARPDENSQMREIGPYSFGASFVVTSTHTPFKRIHEIGEELMKTAKEDTNRMGNSVNWRIMAEEDATADQLLMFERPLFIDEVENRAASFTNLSLVEYLELCKDYSSISSSHRFAIISKMIDLGKTGQDVLENWLKCYDSGQMNKSFSGLLTDSRLRTGNEISGALVPARIATLFELLSISGSSSLKTTREGVQ